MVPVLGPHFKKLWFRVYLFSLHGKPTFKLSIQSQVFGISEFPSRVNLDLPVLLEEPVLCTITKKHKKTPLWLSFATRYNMGLWFWPRVTIRSGSMRTHRWWAGLWVFPKDHSLSSSQDYTWVKTSYLFFPVHECLVYIPDGFLLQIWQQER